MGENKSWSEASQMNGWERRKRGGALRSVMQPNEILLYHALIGQMSVSIERFTVLMSDFSSLGCQW